MSDNGKTIVRSYEVGAPKVKTKVRAFTLYPGDEEMLDSICEFLGTDNQSDAVRTAIRSFAAHCAHLNGSRV